MPLSTIFHLYSVGQFDWKRKPEDPEKTTDLSQITEKRYVVHLALENKLIFNEVMTRSALY
jgi:hypothetical protein